MTITHYSVLLEQTKQFLSPALENSENPIMMDGTLGEGGHSEAFLKEWEKLTIWGVDVDPVMLERARLRLKPFESQLNFVNSWFDLFLEETPLFFDAILLDLGISTYHLKNADRGFSFTETDSLDMRLNPNDKMSALEFVNESSEKELEETIRLFGEEKFSSRIAKAIVEKRKRDEFKNASDLASLIKSTVPSNARYGKIHPATRTFQAIRIAVNEELERLERAIEKGVLRLKDKGRLAIISFHSLEDRVVKQKFRSLALEGGYKIITKKPLSPLENEVKENPPSRSAKLRILEKGDS